MLIKFTFQVGDVNGHDEDALHNATSPVAGDANTSATSSSSSNADASSTASSSSSSATATTAAASAAAAGGTVGGHSSWSNIFDPHSLMATLENNPSVPRNCTITRPPPITKPGRDPVVLRQPLETESTEPITEQDGELLARHREYRYQPERMTWDPHCYECKVRYRDPKPRDLVMYLHAWRYKVRASGRLLSLTNQIKNVFLFFPGP